MPDPREGPIHAADSVRVTVENEGMTGSCRPPLALLGGVGQIARHKACVRSGAHRAVGRIGIPFSKRIWRDTPGSGNLLMRSPSPPSG